ncbi:3-oxoacyl-(acyl-carrier-protein) reductase [gamma proteobacterium NOR5-3]|nr:3-oxoacyl-(acyl-carrier-protein) reductase [gamma proteobacterium NOR5-3]
MNLSGKRIVVTGAASGIGLETARYLKAENAVVIGLDINEPGAHTDEYIRVDLADPDSISHAAAVIEGPVDGLCNVAGVPPTAGFELVMKVNVLGLQQLTYELIPKMSEGAAITNVASLAGAGWPGAVEQVKEFQARANFDNLTDLCGELAVDDSRSYFFAKEVLIIWTMQNRWTWREQGIRINCVSPGPVDTPILPDFLASLGERAEKDKVVSRPGRPEDIAPLIVFMCSSGSDWIRGANIPVDGGLFAHSTSQKYGLGAG